MSDRSILIEGMQGLGDNLHQRAIVRQLTRDRRVFLETPWPSAYHDLVGPMLSLVHRPFGLRTQAKNALRLRHLYGPPAPGDAQRMRTWYTHDQIRQHGSFLAAMAANSGIRAQLCDFQLPIPPEWDDAAQRLLDRWQPAKPLMLYRPLVERTEWAGCASRNPDHHSYADLARDLRERFFVVSIADLAPGKEWMVGERIDADVECHAGDLTFEELAGLTARADLVFCSPGFAIVLAQAVDAPLIAVFGGHEAARFYDHGSSRHLFIEPITPCACFDRRHPCDKRIDMRSARVRIENFIANLPTRVARYGIACAA